MNTDYSSLDRAIANFDIDRGDKFAVVNDNLIVTEGGFTQSFSRTYNDITLGGYNQDAVVQYLTTVADKLDETVREALENDAPIDFTVARETDDRRVLRNRIAHLYKITQEISQNHPRENIEYGDNVCEKFRERFDRFLQNLNDSEGFPELGTRYLNQLQQLNVHLDLCKSIDDFKYGMTTPEITPQETEEKLAKMIADNPPTWKKVALAILGWGGVMLLALPLYALSLLKKVTWDLAESCLRGRVTTRDPIQWWTDYTKSNTWSALQELKQGNRVGELSYALLHNPLITDEHVAVYRRIAESGLDSTEFFELPHNSASILFETCRNLMEAAAANPNCKRIALPIYGYTEGQRNELRELVSQQGFICSGIMAEREVPEASDYKLLENIDLCNGVITIIAVPVIMGAIVIAI